MLSNEVWKPIVGYENLYEVSNYGRVKSKDRVSWNGKTNYTRKGRILKQSKTSTGYWKVELFKEGKKKSKKAHRLVAKAFIPKVEGKDLINHIDGNPLNNKLSNLEWCTQSENMQHAYEIGLVPTNFTHNKERILNEYIENEDATVKGLARKYKCSETTIYKFLKDKGVKIRPSKETQNIYKLDRKRMVEMFEQGYSNKEITNKLGGNYHLIATYRYKHKKGELII